MTGRSLRASCPLVTFPTVTHDIPVFRDTCTSMYIVPVGRLYIVLVGHAGMTTFLIVMVLRFLSHFIPFGNSVVAPGTTLTPPSLESCSMRCSRQLLLHCSRSSFLTRLYLVHPWTRTFARSLSTSMSSVTLVHPCTSSLGSYLPTSL